MNYWINSHWPPFKKDKPTKSSPDPEYHYWVYLPDGRQAAGEELRPGDYVFIYETKWGRPRKDGLEYAEGRQRIIALVSTLTPIFDAGDEPEEYKNGSVVSWRWQARTQLKELGFCSHDNVCEVLGYSTGYTFRGLGDKHSGLKKLTEKQFDTLLDRFRKGT